MHDKKIFQNIKSWEGVVDAIEATNGVSPDVYEYSVSWKDDSGQNWEVQWERFTPCPYVIIRNDEVIGEVTLHSPRLSEYKRIHQQLKSVYMNGRK